MYLINEQLETKWKGIVEADGYTPIADPYRRAVTTVLLENTIKALDEEKRQMLGAAGYGHMLMEAAPTNSVAAAGVQNYDPILISMLRRSLPNLIAYDLCGVQPMTGPTGMIFAMKSRYTTPSGTEALFNEANTAFSGTNAAGANGTVSGSVSNTDPLLDFADSTTYGVGSGMTTANAEALGSTTTHAFAEMAFSIDKVTVTAKERALKGQYSLELAQDLKAIHGLDAEVELANILSTEMLAELNREIVRTIYRSATKGASYGTATAGVFDLDVDANGRWSGEKFKGMYFHFERERGVIARATRRGRGNLAIVSSDVAAALAMTGALDYTPAIQNNLTYDDTGNTFAGTTKSGLKVYIDPYYGGSSNGYELACIGYKGVSSWDAGLFYCPYVPLQMLRAVDAATFQPVIGYKTRYGMVANPYATLGGAGVVGERNTANDANIYYRILRVKNLL
jgi:hypothetical protein